MYTSFLGTRKPWSRTFYETFSSNTLHEFVNLEVKEKRR